MFSSHHVFWMYKPTFRNTSTKEKEHNLPLAPRVEQCTEVCFASFLSGENTTMAVINPAERKLTKRTSLQCASR